MPKRIIDGDALWRSDKLLQIEPAKFRAEYANLLPLALANGVFECTPRRVWIAVYSYNRPDVLIHDVEQILDELERVKLLFRWRDRKTDKTWAYFVGINKPGRLPSRSRVQQKHGSVGPEPPRDEMEVFLGVNRDEEPLANRGITRDQLIVSQRENNGSLGFGSGLGNGGNGQPMADHGMKHSLNFNSTEVAQVLCQKNGWSGRGMVWALKDAIDFQSKQMPEASIEEVGEWLVRAYLQRRQAKGDFAGGPQKFFEQALYRPADLISESAKQNIMADNPATRALAQLEAD